MNEMISTQKEVHLIFIGAIDQAGIHRLGQAINAAMTDQNHVIHLMLQSAGGGVGDGVCLYQIFRSLPVTLITYNCGQVCSSAVLAFLGGSRRISSSAGLFMIHPTHYSPQFAYSGALSRLADAAGLEDARIEQIYSQHITLTPEQKAVHQVGDLWLGAEAAVKSGIATEIGDFSPPPGTRPYFI